MKVGLHTLSLPLAAWHLVEKRTVLAAVPQQLWHAATHYPANGHNQIFAVSGNMALTNPSSYAIRAASGTHTGPLASGAQLNECFVDMLKEVAVTLEQFSAALLQLLYCAFMSGRAIAKLVTFCVWKVWVVVEPAFTSLSYLETSTRWGIITTSTLFAIVIILYLRGTLGTVQATLISLRSHLLTLIPTASVLLFFDLLPRLYLSPSACRVLHFVLVSIMPITFSLTTALSFYFPCRFLSQRKNVAQLPHAVGSQSEESGHQSNRSSAEESITGEFTSGSPADDCGGGAALAAATTPAHQRQRAPSFTLSMGSGPIASASSTVLKLLPRALGPVALLGSDQRPANSSSQPPPASAPPLPLSPLARQNGAERPYGLVRPSKGGATAAVGGSVGSEEVTVGGYKALLNWLEYWVVVCLLRLFFSVIASSTETLFPCGQMSRSLFDSFAILLPLNHDKCAIAGVRLLRFYNYLHCAMEYVSVLLVVTVRQGTPTLSRPILIHLKKSLESFVEIITGLKIITSPTDCLPDRQPWLKGLYDFWSRVFLLLHIPSKFVWGVRVLQKLPHAVLMLLPAFILSPVSVGVGTLLPAVSAFRVLERADLSRRKPDIPELLASLWYFIMLSVWMPMFTFIKNCIGFSIPLEVHLDYLMILSIQLLSTSPETLRAAATKIGNAAAVLTPRGAKSPERMMSPPAAGGRMSLPAIRSGALSPTSTASLSPPSSDPLRANSSVPPPGTKQNVLSCQRSANAECTNNVCITPIRGSGGARRVPFLNLDQAAECVVSVEELEVATSDPGDPMTSSQTNLEETLGSLVSNESTFGGITDGIATPSGASERLSDSLVHCSWKRDLDGPRDGRDEENFSTGDEGGSQIIPSVGDPERVVRRLCDEVSDCGTAGRIKSPVADKGTSHRNAHRHNNCPAKKRNVHSKTGQQVECREGSDPVVANGRNSEMFCHQIGCTIDSSSKLSSSGPPFASD